MSTETIYNEFGVQLKNFILSKVSDKNVAEDILQESFVKIHTKINTLQNEDKLVSWIFQITRNTINDYFRKNTPTLEITIEPAEEPNKEIEDELNTCLLCAIDNLPKEYKRAVYLSDIKGMKQLDVAKKLNISYSGLKSRVQRGRKI